jgi:predicted kinase
LTEETLTRFHSLIDARALQGRTRDCHGDLHLDHIYYFPERPPPAALVIVDCIEFTERFRYLDPVADIAFPVMDFAFHARRDLAAALTEAYFRATGDEEGRGLLPMYTGYRATVRGSVEGLKLAEKEVLAAERAVDLQHARAHWLLALVELEESFRKPCLVLVGGLPGTGKSSLARGLAEAGGFSVIRSDMVRKELGDSTTGGSLYSPEWTERTYAECLRRAEELLFQGKRVIVDATFREEAHRRTFLDTAGRWGVPGVVLLCRAEPVVVRERLANRRGDVSDADWSVHELLTRQWEELAPTTRATAHEIDTGGGQEQAVHQAEGVLRELRLYR